MINGIELEGLEQIQTFKPFEYSDNIFLNPITLVNNSVINIGNGFINTWNSAVSSYQYINQNGWGAYGSELGSQTKDAFTGIGNYFSSGYKYITETPANQQFTEALQSFGKAQNYENFATAVTSGLLTKNFSLPKMQITSQTMQRTLAARGGKAIVIGEGMEAVEMTAKTLQSQGINARWYQAWSKNFPTDRLMTPSELSAAQARNARWLNSKISQGYTIYDIGIDATRATRSPFYQLERNILEQSGYPTIVIPR